MCGIIGAISVEDLNVPLFDEVKSNLSILHHRGPDHSNYFKDERACLGHTRLSIIDLNERSNQPFCLDGRHVLVYNGEIYNYKELRSDLLKEGESFSTESDTEVLYKLLIQKGERALELLNGFFAFCFYDKQSGDILLARDRMGIKPLWYSQSPEAFSFASELKALPKAHIQKEIDGNSLRLYLQLGYVPAPHSILKGICKLNPGHYITLSKGVFQVEPYWFPEKHQQEETSSKKLKDLIYDSVESRLLADVPVGCFLSGGLDSSIISAVAKELKPDLKTFSIGFPENSFLDESKDANQVVEHLKTEHHHLSFYDKDVPGAILNFWNSMDEPFADSSSVAFKFLSSFASESVKVALSGDGADELFGGYNKHRAWVMLNSKIIKPSLNLIPSFNGSSRENSYSNRLRQLNRLKHASKLNPKERYFFLASFSSDQAGIFKEIDSEYQDRKNIILEGLENFSLNSMLKKDQNLVLANDMLCKVDTMSMAHSLEVRTPFLDHRIVDFANRLPEKSKTDLRNGKIILRKAFAHLLPKEILKKPKHGFEIPLESWIRKYLGKELEVYLSRDFIEEQGIFNFEAINSILHKFAEENEGSEAFRIWALLCFQKWWEREFTSENPYI